LEDTRKGDEYGRTAGQTQYKHHTCRVMSEEKVLGGPKHSEATPSEQQSLSLPNLLILRIAIQTADTGLMIWKPQPAYMFTKA